MRRVAVALLHHPVVDRRGDVVTTAITNLDLHDISRSALTFGLERYFIVHPIAAQRELASRVRAHWLEGSGGRRIPDRKPAMEIVRVVDTLDDALADFSADTVDIWTTSARPVGPPMLAFGEAGARLRGEGPPVLLCFGTGWGLAPEVHARAAAQLEPIGSLRSDGDNHLSVRAAAAIIFDRLLGTR